MLLRTTALALLMSTPALAVTLVDATVPDVILSVARDFGTASFDNLSNGDPGIKGRIDDVTY
ncbi:hypothetical protein [Deinococcus knuensis]|uniref:ABC transporter substrate-binding protein n=1 Tax=Deinococcus knuensis TaxID=1837380 RepID=A0ABQ2SGS7_9DEIO|nr:hypothetical protein [Deinococcus knuensis]GGS27948.1 hypothetical protein GCM10008961_19440 [Deinococcus knuensis]